MASSPLITTANIKIADIDHLKYREMIKLLGEIAVQDAGEDEAQARVFSEINRLFQIEWSALYLRDDLTDQWFIKKVCSADSGWTSHVVHADELGEMKKVMLGVSWKAAPLPNGDWVHGYPLTVEDKPIGGIEFRTSQAELDVNLLEIISRVFAHNLVLSRLADQAQETIQEMQTFQGQLLNSRNTLRALFDSSPASIYIVDPQFRLIAINMTRANLAGKPPQKLVGEDCFSALYGLENPCPGCQVAETFQSSLETRRLEHREYEQSGRVEIEISTFPIWDNEHQVVQVFLYEEDVTERLQLQSSLAQSEKLAAVGQLAAGVAHEINNPLTTIQANAQLLQRSMTAPDDGQAEMVDLIIEASERATQAVRDLLDFARREHYEVKPTDLNETIQRTLALMGPELGSRSISLQFAPGIDLPQVNASQDHLQGVWLNLLINAIDAIGEGPGVIKIESRRVDDLIQITVADSGPGIPKNQISRIFEPFFTTKEPGRGTGLGLSVCHQIVARHGGQIRVHSRVSEGTTFTVVLPVT